MTAYGVGEPCGAGTARVDCVRSNNPSSTNSGITNVPSRRSSSGGGNSESGGGTRGGTTGAGPPGRLDREPQEPAHPVGHSKPASSRSWRRRIGMGGASRC